MKHRRLLTCAAVLSALCGGSQAALVTYYFSGTFSTATGLATSFASPEFTGQFSYDSNLAPFFSGGNFSQFRLPAGALTAASVDGSASSQGSPNNLVNTVWGSTITSSTVSGFGDYLRMNASADFTGSWQGFVSANLLLLDTGRTALGSNLSGLPTSLPGLAGWTGTEFSLFSQTGISVAAGALGCLSAQANVCSATRVPEPGTLALVALALAGLRSFRRPR